MEAQYRSGLAAPAAMTRLRAVDLAESYPRTHDPFPPRPHRTGRADFPHPALGQVSRASMRREEASNRYAGSVLAFTYSFSRNSSSFIWAVRLITNLPLVQVSRVAHFALHACCAKYPDRPLDVLRSIAPVQRGGLPQIPEGSASAAILSGPAQASLALRPACLLNPLAEAFCLGASRTTVALAP